MVATGDWMTVTGGLLRLIGGLSYHPQMMAATVDYLTMMGGGSSYHLRTMTATAESMQITGFSLCHPKTLVDSFTMVGGSLYHL